MITENRWGVLYCPKHEGLSNPSKRWEKIEKALRDNNVDYAYRDWETDRKSTRLNSSHRSLSRMPSSA